jgi:transcriptional regulator with XRE-family HTH domain
LIRLLVEQIYRLKGKRQGISMLTRDQVRLARTALHWTIKDLAKAAGITPQTVTRFENGGNITIATLEKIQAAIEHAGVTLVPANGGPATIRPPRQSGG